MQRCLFPPLVAAAPLVSGCATVISGSSQKINVSSVPEGARCTRALDQALDKRLAQIEAMRASAKVRRPAS